MKTLKSIQTALLIPVITIFAGCTDQITSPGDTFMKTNNKEYKPEVDRHIIISEFHSQIRLKPYRFYTFNYKNTGLVRFTSINVNHVNNIQSEGLDDVLCRNIIVYDNSSTNKETYGSIGCQNSNLDLKEITIENTGSSFLDLDVVLSGEAGIKEPSEK